MKIEFQRAVDRWAGIPICRLLSLVERVRGARKPDFPPRRILVILLSEMGSLVLAQPMFVRLRERYPTATLHVLLFEKNRQLLDLLGVVPPENVITVSDRSLGAMAGDCFKALRGFRRDPFDVAIDGELFARVSSIFAYLSGAAVRVGFHPHTQEGLYRGSFVNRPVLYNPYRHLTDQFTTLVDAVESTAVPKAKDGPARPHPQPRVSIAADELRRVRERLEADFPAIKGKKLVLVNPSGGILPIRAWPLEHYVSVCAALLGDGHAVGVIGLPDDKPFGIAIRERCRSERCLDLTGYTESVRHLLGVFHGADLLISNDGGPGQFAALTPLPTIVLFGPETPVLYGTLGERACCLFSGWSCSPCLSAYNHRTSPCDGDNQCLKQILPEQVLLKAREILGGDRPGAGSRLP
jgi:ADP-heptose:LPS heptosyltransferase